MHLKVITTPNEFLKEKSQEIKVEDLQTKEMQEFFDSMIETMIKDNGIGLAAPQVGKHIRAVVVTVDEKPEVFVNPEITERSFKTVKVEEGCLSIPGITGIVKRHKGITLKALDRHGKEVTIQTQEFESVIFQHEIDHLDGILFVDRTTKLFTE